jgi:hypothetical protein
VRALLFILILIGVIMSFNPILPSSGSGANNTQINKLAADVRGSKVTQVFKDAKDRRVLLGKGKNDFYGLKVSKPGFDVYSTADENLVFNSNNNVFKIVDSGVVDLVVTNPSTSATAVYNHNLGYKPAFVAFADIIGNQYSLPLPTFDIYGTGSGTVLNFQKAIQADSSTTQLLFSYYAASAQPTTTYKIRYYIFKETAN